jgi:hypothetical protein
VSGKRLPIDCYLILVPLDDKPRRYAIKMGGLTFLAVFPEDLTPCQCIRTVLDTLSFWISEQKVPPTPRVKIHLDTLPHKATLETKYRLRVPGDQVALRKSTSRLKELLFGDSFLEFLISPNGGAMI